MISKKHYCLSAVNWGFVFFFLFSCTPRPQERESAGLYYYSSIAALDSFEDKHGMYLNADDNRFTFGLTNKHEWQSWDNKNERTSQMADRLHELDALMKQKDIRFYWLWLYAWIDGTPKLTADKDCMGRKAGENLIDLFSVYAPGYRFGFDNLSIMEAYPELEDVPFLSYYAGETLFFVNRGLTPTNKQFKLSPDIEYTLELPLRGYLTDWTIDSRTFYFSTALAQP